VSHAIWLGSFVPQDQGPKLEILEDARSLLGPTLSSPANRRNVPGAGESWPRPRAAPPTWASSPPGATAPPRSWRRPSAARSPGGAVVPALEANLSDGAAHRLEDVRLAVQAAPVSLDTIPPDIRNDWVTVRREVPRRRCSRRATPGTRRCSGLRRGGPARGARRDRECRFRSRSRRGPSSGPSRRPACSPSRRSRPARAHPAQGAGHRGGSRPAASRGLLTLATSVLAGMPLNFANIVTFPCS
jgi:uncharacterized protein